MDERAGRDGGSGSGGVHVQQFPAAHMELPYFGPQFWATAIAAKPRASTYTCIFKEY